MQDTYAAQLVEALNLITRELAEIKELLKVMAHTQAAHDIDKFSR